MSANDIYLFRGQLRPNDIVIRDETIRCLNEGQSFTWSKKKPTVRRRLETEDDEEIMFILATLERENLL